MPQASSQTSIWIHCLTLMIVLISLVDVFDKETHAADVGTYCSGSFGDGQISNITCKVNSTSISTAGCYVGLSKVLFTFSSASGSPSTLCSVDYPPTPTSCAPNSTAEVCFCAEQIADVITYQFNFKGDASYNGGNFVCDICSRSSKPVIREISPNCTNIIIVATTMTTTTSTTTAAGTITITTITTIITTVTTITKKELFYLFFLLLLPAGLIICLCCFRWAKAVKDWDGHQKSNLHFKKGETITLLQTEGSFWKGEINGRTGFFPKDFVRENSGNLRTVVALHDWNQDVELTFKRGNTICVTQRMERVWKGIRCCKIGWFPKDSVTLKEKCCAGKQSDSQNISMGSSGNIPNASEKASLQSVELRSRSATSEESSSNVGSHRSSRAVPIPPSKLTPIERNSAKDVPELSPGRRPLSPISGRKEDQ